MGIYAFPKFLTAMRRYINILLSTDIWGWGRKKLKAKHFSYFRSFHTIVNIEQEFVKTFSNSCLLA